MGEFRKAYSASYKTGVLISSVLHIVLGIGASLMLEHGANKEFMAPQVFSVTLEGGERLGGISQVPTEDKKSKIKAVPVNPLDGASKEEKSKDQVNKVEDTAKKAEATEKEADIKSPAAVEEAEKKKEEEKRKLEEDKKKKVEDEKKRIEEEKKKAQEEKKKEEEQAKKEKEDRDKKLRQAIQAAKNRAATGEGETGRYLGESANAGGQGFGAAALGGKSMGGGTLASIEFIAYRNELENHIKAGWRWMEGGRRLQAQVIMYLSNAGVVEQARVVSSSGNSYFDDSVLRAVYKSSPVPAPPDKLYEQFREVRITFDSQE